MSKFLDLTGKLNYEERPQVKIGDVVLDVNNDAVALLKVTAIITEDESTVQDAYKIYDALFDEKNQKKIEKLHLTMDAFRTFIHKCAYMVLDIDEDDEGEAQTPAMT